MTEASTSTAREWAVTADAELPDFPAELVKQIEREKLDKASVKAILEEFELTVSLSHVAAEARAIVVTDASQTDLMAQARDLRIRLRDERIRIDKIREQVKKPYLLKTQAIDGISRIIRRMFEAEEKHLLEQETFLKRQEEKRIADLREERLKLLEPYGYQGSIEFLGIATVAEFDLLLAGAKATHLEKLEDIERRERETAERLESERLLRVENDRLRREKEEADRIAREAQAEAGRKVREAEAEATRQREESEHKERERLEAEEAEKKRIADEKAKAAAAPDREKLIAFADAIQSVELPSFISPDAQKLAERIAHDRDQFVTRIKADAESVRFDDCPF